jgi:hypothetical protein
VGFFRWFFWVFLGGFFNANPGIFIYLSSLRIQTDLQKKEKKEQIYSIEELNVLSRGLESSPEAWKQEIYCNL